MILHAPIFRNVALRDIIGSLLFILVLLPFGGTAQEEGLKAWSDTALLGKADAAKHLEYYSEEEKKIIFYINLVRAEPVLFERTLLKNYLKEQNIKADKWTKSLIKKLKEAESLPMLEPREDLYEAAKNHAQDMGQTGRTGHNSSDGVSYPDRIAPFVKIYASINENCNYGLNNGLAIVIDLLIDEGVPNFGHRRNILDVDARFVGVSIQPHKKWQFNCVQEFTGGLLK